MEFWVEDLLGVQTLGDWHAPTPSWQLSPLMQQLTCRPRHRPPYRRWRTGKLCRAGHRLPQALALRSNPSRGRVRVLRCRLIPSRIRCALQHAPMLPKCSQTASCTATECKVLQVGPCCMVGSRGVLRQGFVGGMVHVTCLSKETGMLGGLRHCCCSSIILSTSY